MRMIKGFEDFELSKGGQFQSVLTLSFTTHRVLQTQLLVGYIIIPISAHSNWIVNRKKTMLRHKRNEYDR